MINHALRFTLFAIGLGLAALVWFQTRQVVAPGAEALTPQQEATSMLGGFGAFLIVALIVAAAAILYVLPWIATKASDVAYDSGAKVEDDPRWKAVALRNNGDFEGAIEVFRQIDQDEPKDRFALTEIYQIQLKKLEDPALAWGTLQEGTAREWPTDEDRGYFWTEMARLAHEVYQDPASEIAVLEAMMEALPGTRFAANARHRLTLLQGGDDHTKVEHPVVARPVVPRPGGPQQG